MTGRLAGKVALVTGAASGQGAAEARLFAAEGADVVVTDIDAEGATSIASEIGAPAIATRLDVTDEAEWAAAVERGVEAFGHLDVLVNNAGIGFPPRRLEREDPDEHRRVIEVNLHGVYLGMRAVTPVMSAQTVGRDREHLVHRRLGRRRGHDELRGEQVRGHGNDPNRRARARATRHPGELDPPGRDQDPTGRRRATRRRWRRLQVVLDRQPIARMGTPEEVAYLALYLASDESSYCTGAQFVIDGGHLAGPYREGFADA